MQPDSISQIWSNSKTVNSIILGRMVDQGHLDLDESVSTYWPEFKKGGKHFVKVKDVLRHDAGLKKFKT